MATQELWFEQREKSVEAHYVEDMTSMSLKKAEPYLNLDCAILFLAFVPE